MPKRIIDKSLNHTRLNILAKGFLDITDISKFVPCGTNKASEIYDTIRKQVETEGYENLRRVILAKRILDFMDLSIDSIKVAAKAEERGGL